MDTIDMKSRYWEKLWHDIIDDPALGPLDDALKWRFVTLIIAAGQQDPPDGTLPELSELAWMLRVSEEQLRTQLPTLAQRGLVTILPDTTDRWFVINYTKRQAAMSSLERKRRQRSASASASTFALKKEYTDTEAEADNVTMVVTNRDNNVTRDILAEHGITINRTTRGLLELEPEYVQAHLGAAAAAGHKPGLAIKRMLDGDPAPPAPLCRWCGQSHHGLCSYSPSVRS